MFEQNVGMLVIRHSTRAEGYFCKECAEDIFWPFTGKTMLFGWWGVISFLTAPFMILGNIGGYLNSRRLEDPGGGSRILRHAFWKMVVLAPLSVAGLCLFLLIVTALFGNK